MADKEFLVCSCGFGSRAQFSLETLASLRACGVVLSNNLDDRTVSALSSLGVRLRRFNGACSPSDAASELRRHKRVGLLTYGNPFFINHSLPLLLRRLPKGTKAVVLPALSSFDSLVSILGLSRIPAAGLLSLDLNYFDSSTALRPECDTFLFSPFVLNQPGPGWRRRREALLRAASAAYPAGYPVYAIRSADGEDSHEVLAGCPACLDPLLDRCGLQHTLAIPSPGLRRSLGLPSRRPPFRPLQLCGCARSGPSVKKRKPA